MTKHQLSSDINPSALTRQQRLIMAMALNPLTFAELGRRLNISDVAARKLCLADTAPPLRVEQMAVVFGEYGLSADLLPEGKLIPPGPRPKSPACGPQPVATVTD